jgi:O-acetyl-ADP-ribose deacetylase
VRRPNGVGGSPEPHPAACGMGNDDEVNGAARERAARWGGHGRYARKSGGEVGGSIDGVQLEVIDGDIATFAVDALVNAANDHLWMGAGVAGALKRAGGSEVEREAVAKGPIAIGDAVATTAGHLPARWVIHAAVMGQDLRTSAEIIERATLSTLRVADELGAHSVALPAFGTGVGGFSVEECAQLMAGACAGYLRAHPQTQIGRIVFATFGLAATAAFEAAVAVATQ